jgi:hypothetical protein
LSADRAFETPNCGCKGLERRLTLILCRWSENAGKQRTKKKKQLQEKEQEEQEQAAAATTSRKG